MCLLIFYIYTKERINMNTSKTITDVKKLEESLNKKIKPEDVKYVEAFFKTRFVRISNKKIVYPTKKDIAEKNKELYNLLNEHKKQLRFWVKEKHNADNYYKTVSFKKHFRKIYWLHKIKMLTDAEYKADVEKARLSEDTLMDVENNHVLDTFLVDSDYRKKLGETVTNSVVYRNHNVGDSDRKKQVFKKELALKKIESITKKIESVRNNIKVNNIILKYKE
jgi:hypothetical protein